MSKSLSIIESCEGCGACCLVVVVPPFRRVFREEGEEAWERLRWDRPDLHDAIVAAELDRRTRGEPSFGTPCLWYDTGSRRCRHHAHRPRACHDFAIGAEDCRDARRRAGVPA